MHMPPRLKTYICHGSLSRSFSKRGNYQNGKRIDAREGPELGTTNHMAHMRTWESVELLNVLITVVVTQQYVFVKTQNCTVNSMNVTVCKL